MCCTFMHLVPLGFPPCNIRVEEAVSNPTYRGMSNGVSKAVRKGHRSAEPQRVLLRLILLVISFIFCTIIPLPNSCSKPCSQCSELGQVVLDPRCC